MISMIENLILHNGNICVVTPDIPADMYPIREDGFHGTLIGISDDDNAKTCFIFKGDSEDHIIRFYLCKNQRPASRLLMLLCSQITCIKNSIISVISEKSARPGYSWLRMSIPALGVYGEAPSLLPSGFANRNTERITLILSALGLVVCDVDTDGNVVTEPQETSVAEDAATEASAADDLRDHAPVIVSGISEDVSAAGLTRRNTRDIALVAGFPLLSVSIPGGQPVTDDENSKYEYVKRAMMNSSCTGIRVITHTFITLKEREAYMLGVKDSLGNDSPMFFVHREHINELMQIYSANL